MPAAAHLPRRASEASPRRPSPDLAPAPSWWVSMLLLEWLRNAVQPPGSRTCQELEHRHQAQRPVQLRSKDALLVNGTGRRRPH